MKLDLFTRDFEDGLAFFSIDQLLACVLVFEGTAIKQEIIEQGFIEQGFIEQLNQRSHGRVYLVKGLIM